MNTAIVIFLIGALTGVAIYPLVAEAWRYWWQPPQEGFNPHNTTEEKTE